MILCFLKWYSGSCKCKCRNHMSQCLCKSILPPYSWAEHSVSVSDAVCHAVCQYLWCNAFWKTIKGCIYSDYLCVILKICLIVKVCRKKEKIREKTNATCFHSIPQPFHIFPVEQSKYLFSQPQICDWGNMCKSWDPVMTSCVRCLTKA